MLVLQRAVKTFRLGPHPAPIIPVDVVSRAIVHSALGWGASSATAAAPGAADGAARTGLPAPSTENSRGGMSPAPEEISATPKEAAFPSDLGEAKGASLLGKDAVRRRKVEGREDTVADCGGGGASAALCPSTDSGEATLGVARPCGGAAAGAVEDAPDRRAASPDVVIRNLAWATHPAPADGCDSPAGVTWQEGGRMPSFREISGLLYDYAVLRGLRPSFEALAMRASFVAASMSPADADSDNDGGAGGGGKPAHNTAASRSKIFDFLHLSLDRSPVWALRGLAVAANRFLSSPRRHRRHRRRLDGDRARAVVESQKERRGGWMSTVRRLDRLDRLADLPTVYETFTWRQYFFDSALRVPCALSPEGYALETALASELLQRNL